MRPTPPWRGGRKPVPLGMEPKGGTPERRWRKGAGGRISQETPGRAGKSTVQKEKIYQKQKKMHLFGAKFRLTLWAICLIM